MCSLTSFRSNINFSLVLDGLGEDDNGEYETYVITAESQGLQLGFLIFKVYGNYTSTPDVIEGLDGKRVLFISDLDVSPEHRYRGTATLLYLTLSEVYKSRFRGWLVRHFFYNPVAEYTLISLVTDGMVANKLYDKRFIGRSPKFYKSDLVGTLRKKLPREAQSIFAEGF